MRRAGSRVDSTWLAAGRIPPHNDTDRVFAPSAPPPCPREASSIPIKRSTKLLPPRPESILGLATFFVCRTCAHDKLYGARRVGVGAATAQLRCGLYPQVEYVVEIDVGQQRRSDASGNVANRLPEFSITIPRKWLRPAYGEGFQGAPLQLSRPHGGRSA
jgi:hypothetical protein